MSLTDTRAAPLADDRVVYVQWGPVIAGALAAAALAFVLHSFAAAIGIAVSSTAPTWRDASIALWILTGLYLVLVALASFGLGGYVAGRARARLTGATVDEIEFRDGAHGLLVWALAIVITAFLAWATAQSVTRLAAPSAGSAGPASSVGGENIIAYDLDRLFRAERRPANVDLTYARAEAARILLSAAGHSGMTGEDRTYLNRLTASVTGLGQAEADKRAESGDCQRAQQYLPRAPQCRDPGVHGRRRGLAGCSRCVVRGLRGRTPTRHRRHALHAMELAAEG